MDMNRFVGLGVIAGCALAAGAAVRMMRDQRAARTEEPSRQEIDRFENEGGHAAPI